MKSLREIYVGMVLAFGCMTGVGIAQDTVAIEGCLTPGPRAGYFMLTDEVTGEAVVVAGRTELSQHARNHRERLTGRYVTEDNRDVFDVQQDEHIADACQPLYERVNQRVEELISDLRRNAALGFRVGVALDPEMMLIGAHAEFATGVTNFLFRPNIEFGLGEVTAEYAANVEGVYKMPFTRQSGSQLEVWHVYFGGGPSITVFNQEFRERDFNESSEGDLFTFDDRDTNLGFNVLVGLSKANGFFAEMKGGAYGNPAIRVLVGFTF